MCRLPRNRCSKRRIVGKPGVKNPTILERQGGYDRRQKPPRFRQSFYRSPTKPIVFVFYFQQMTTVRHIESPTSLWAFSEYRLAGLSVLGDVYKTDVFALARFINRDQEVIPLNTITKPPSAELRPDQKDSDSLPEYDVLDRILFDYIELAKSPAAIVESGFEEATVRRTILLVNRNEYKRFQTPPILRVSSKAFGFGRKMPLVAKYAL